MIIVLVGHGSIGSKYKDEICKRGISKDSLIIIDSNISIVNKLKKEGFNCFESIKNLNKLNKKIDFAIIANWGPEHINSANELSKLGCKKFIIEKPVSSNLEELSNFEKVIEEKQIFVTVHHHWKYVGIEKLIKENASKYDLNEPVGIRLIGGALGLCTNGIHWLDLSQEILESPFESVVADLDIDYINPRDESLAFIGGMSSFKMRNKSFIHVSFSNKNSQSIRAEIVYRNGIIDISTKGLEGKLTIYKRKQDNLNNYEKITRHAIFNMIDQVEFVNKRTIPDVLDDLFKSDCPRVSIQRAKKSLEMIIGAIQSSNQNKKIEWNQIEDQNIRIS